ncbi:acyltransferase family protein [Citrobacter farmeri]
MSRNNSFDLLRLFAAVMVVVYHHAGFMKHPLVNPGSWFPLDSIWVQMFISISGYLVTKSFITSRGFDQYMVKRCLRIFPAIILCSFVVIYILVPFWESNVIAYQTSEKTFKSFINMSLLHGINVGHAESPYGLRTLVNPPLWTLAYEFFLYICLGLIMSINRTWVAPAIMLSLSIILCDGFSDSLKNSYFYGVQYWTFLRLGMNFYVGSLMFLTVDKWGSSRYKLTMAIACVIILYCLSGNTADVDILGRMAFSVLTILFGVTFATGFGSGKYEISYGVYIWSWPIQAIVVSTFKIDFWYSLGLSLIIISLISFVSRNYVEERFLKMKPL